MIKIENNLLEYDESQLPKWWQTGQTIRIIQRDNSFFVYRNNDKRIAKQIIIDGGSLKINTPDGWYDVLEHSKDCVRLVFNRTLDKDPESTEQPADIDPRSASEYDLNYWIFRQSYNAIKEKNIPKGFGDAIRVLRDAYHVMRIERKGITERPMETREIVIEEDDDDDED